MMRGQTIQFSGEQGTAAILASLDDDVSIDALSWGGRTTPIFLATDHAEQRHLLGDNVVRVVIGADPFDVEAHTLTLRFPNADEAARFRVKVLAGALIIGTLAVPTAFAASQMASSATQDETNVAPIVAPVVVKQAAPVVDTPEKPGFTIQSKGTKEKTGEDNSTGSSITWVHSRNDEIK